MQRRYDLWQVSVSDCRFRFISIVKPIKPLHARPLSDAFATAKRASAFTAGIGAATMQTIT